MRYDYVTLHQEKILTQHIHLFILCTWFIQLCEAPSPAAIKAWLQDTATQEQINLAGKSATANKLVYMECLAGTSTK